MKLVFALVSVLAVLWTASALADSVVLTGLDGKAKTLDAGEIAAMPHSPAQLSEHGKVVSYSGVSLMDLTALVGAPHGDMLKGPAFSVVVLVTASDGYRIVLTLADLDPAFKHSGIILADSSDGKPLDAHEGPFRLVVEGEPKPARSARSVTRISLINAQ